MSLLPLPAPAAISDERVVLTRCLEVLRRSPAGLVTDIDGTISAIAATPGAATVAPAARAALDRLRSSLTLIGIVTGRAAAVAEGMVGIEGLVYIGNHGMERRHAGAEWAHPEANAEAAAMGSALREFTAEIERLGWAEGVVVEDKRLSGSIHYRLAPDQAAAYETLLPLAVATAEKYGLLVTSGRQILEFRPNVVVNKGTAIIDLVAGYRLRGVVFLGDDLTDVDGFRALRVLRDRGEVAALMVGVLSAETPPEVVANVDVTVRDVDACAALLTALAEELGSSTPPSLAPV